MTDSTKRNRRFGSIKNELLDKSREAMLAAVQIFNNPLISFKSELFIVTACIAWTYLIHAYFRSIDVEYRYFKQIGSRRKYSRTAQGAFKYLGLEDCLNHAKCPIDQNTSNNLKFLIGIRHEIEHQMTSCIDDALSAKLQACCLNFNHKIKKHFGEEYGIDKNLSFSLQLVAFRPEHVEQIKADASLPSNVSKYITTVEGRLDSLQLNDSAYAYRLWFVKMLAKREGQADLVVQFLDEKSTISQKVNNIILKEHEKQKLLPTDVVKQMQLEGFSKFRLYEHTKLWKQMDAKQQSKGFGTEIAKTWYWYLSWVDEVRKHCNDKKGDYK